MALSKGKRIEQGGGGGLLNLGIVAGVACFTGGIAMEQGGFVRPARAGQGGNDLAQMADAASCRVVGFFLGTLTGGASDGAVTIDIQSDEALLCKNAAGVDAVTASQVGHYCFVVDDETVAGNSAGNTRPVAGIVRTVDSGGVMVEMGPEVAAEARRIHVLPFAISETDTLAGTSCELVSPVAGAISRLTVIVQKDVTVGGDVTAAVGVTAVAGLVCTIANGATKGTVVTDTPTAGDATRIVAPGGRIQVIPGAPFATAGAVSGTVEITY